MDAGAKFADEAGGLVACTPAATTPDKAIYAEFRRHCGVTSAGDGLADDAKLLFRITIDSNEPTKKAKPVFFLGVPQATPFSTALDHCNRCYCSTKADVSAEHHSGAFLLTGGYGINPNKTAGNVFMAHGNEVRERPRARAAAGTAGPALLDSVCALASRTPAARLPHQGRLCALGVRLMTLDRPTAASVPEAEPHFIHIRHSDNQPISVSELKVAVSRFHVRYEGRSSKRARRIEGKNRSLYTDRWPAVLGTPMPLGGVFDLSAVAASLSPHGRRLSQVAASLSPHGKRKSVIPPDQSASSWTSPWFQRGPSSSPWWSRGQSASGSLHLEAEPRRAASSPAPLQRRRRRKQRGVSDQQPASELRTAAPASSRSTTTVALQAEAKRLQDEDKRYKVSRAQRSRAKKQTDPAKIAQNAEVHREWVRRQRQEAADGGRLQQPGAAQEAFHLQMAHWTASNGHEIAHKREAVDAVAEKAGAAVRLRDRPGGVGASVEDIFRPPPYVSADAHDKAAAWQRPLHGR